MENKELKIREDLNEMVKEIKFKHIVTKFGERNVCNVTLFNDEVVEFKDADSFYDVLKSYAKCGEKDFIKSTKLVDEFKKDEEGNNVGIYTCVLYELKDGTVARLFPTKFNARVILNNYYNFFKKQQKIQK